MTQQEIKNYLETGERIDPLNARKTKITYKNYKSQICGFYNSYQHPDYEANNSWYILLEGQAQAKLVSGENISSLKQV